MAAHLKYKSGSSWIDYNLVIYPVGAYYFSSSSTSPANLFGGTWSAVTGRFLYMNAGTDTGGNNTISHNHGLTNGAAQVIVNSNGTIGIGKKSTSSWTVTYHSVNNTPGTDSGWNSTYGAKLLGITDSASVSNMPAYQTVYAWRRTA